MTRGSENLRHLIRACLCGGNLLTEEGIRVLLDKQIEEDATTSAGLTVDGKPARFGELGDYFDLRIGTVDVDGESLAICGEYKRGISVIRAGEQPEERFKLRFTVRLQIPADAKADEPTPKVELGEFSWIDPVA